MLSKISGFLFMGTVSELLFSFISYNKLMKHIVRGHKNRHFKLMYFNFIFCEICF